MKRRFDLMTTGALLSAILVTACNQRDDWTAQRDTAICVDRRGDRVPDVDCSPGTSHAGTSPFLWYYLGRNSSIPPYGSGAYGGGYTRTSGATYFHAPISTDLSSDEAVSRGGFGESAHGFGDAGE